MDTITLTSKRQATLPKALCDELKVEPGDRLALERRVLDGEVLWVVRPHRNSGSKPDWSWIGSARAHATGKSHGLKAIRASIARGRAREAARGSRKQ